LILNKNTTPAEPIQNEPIPIAPATTTDTKNAVEVTDEMVNNIKNDSYLNILVQIKTFDNLNVNYEPLLEAAMRIASEQNLMQTPEEGIYVEYVPRDIIHNIIFELSGIRIQDPIIIDDFYYLYSEEGDYYYVVPIGANWLQLRNVNSISYIKDGDQYVVKCSAYGGSEDVGGYEMYENMELRMKYKPANKYVKYQLISILPGKVEE
jgi:hypothetical protein